MVTFWGVLLVLGVLAVGRYGADSRGTADPTGRDPVWSGATRRTHSPRGDLSTAGRLLAHHLRLWASYEQALRPWETDSSVPARTSAAQTTVERAGAPTPRPYQADASRATASSRASGDKV